MKYHKSRKIVRLRSKDYRDAEIYFVTICTKNFEHFFGEIIKSKMHLNELGEIINENWLSIPKHFSNIILDEYVVMPNHLHGILFIKHNIQRVGPLHATALHKEIILENYYSKISPKPGSLSVAIRSFKSACTKKIYKEKISDYFAWQYKFYEHIVRRKSLHAIRNYIKQNPKKWKEKNARTT